MKKILIWAIQGYQKGISVFFPARCRFYPSCSHYAKTVIEQQSLLKAIGLISWRLLRCQPLSTGGFDYPPEPYQKIMRDVAKKRQPKTLKDSL